MDKSAGKSLLLWKSWTQGQVVQKYIGAQWDQKEKWQVGHQMGQVKERELH